MNNFVESDVKIKDVREAVEKAHIHDNRDALDKVIFAGDETKYLGEDGEFHNVPALFDAHEFVEKYNQVSGNVKAAVGEDGKLILNTQNTFAYQTDGKVVGAIEVEQATARQLNVSIAEVDVNTGGVSENPIHYIKTGNGLSAGFSNNAILISIVPTEEPFSSKMNKQVLAEHGDICVFDGSGQAVDSGLKLDDLARGSDLISHAGDLNLHVTVEEKVVWNGKQGALSIPQLSAVNSGIDASKVAAFEAYATNKQSVGGNTPNMDLVTDGDGNIITVAKFNPDTKIDRVPVAVAERIPVLNSAGGVKDSGILLGTFDPNLTVREYVDTAVAMSVAGSSYRGAYTYFGTQGDVEAVVGAEDGDTALVFELVYGELQSMTSGRFESAQWVFEDSLLPAPTGGAWFEIDKLLTLDEPVAGRVIVKMDGFNPATLDVRPATSVVLDDVTIGRNSFGQAALKMKLLGSGKSVLNTASADNVEYGLRGGEIKTIKEVLDEILQFVDSN